MFSKLATAFTAFTALAILAAATPAPNDSALEARQSGCATGTLQCCNSVQSADSAAIAPILAALGVVLQDVNVPVGLTCSPISVVGVGDANACSANTVCCDDNSFGGLLSIGCLPASL
ncbi:fungal hydrophobin [Trametes cingulata]|nr:fungal hydrophobin [Trametes cingulata]